MTQSSNYAILTLLLGAFPMQVAGCGPAQELAPEVYASGDIDEPADADDEFRGWQMPISEDDPPAFCAGIDAVNGIQCLGKFCSMVAILCTNTWNPLVGDHEWTPTFSSDGPNQKGECRDDEQWMTGLECSGKRCGKLKLLCTTFGGSFPTDCQWSSAHSQEHPPFEAPNGYFIKAMDCTGVYCDNKRYNYCKMN